MGFFDKVGSFLKREAKDLGEAAEGVKDKLDDELTRREQELRMTPSEKIAALQQQAAATDAKLDAIADKAAGQSAMADAVAEVGEVPPPDPAIPNITHIVLPDGRVKSGAEVGQVVDDDGRVHVVPSVDVPSVEDLQKSDEPVADPAAAEATGLPETEPTPATITESDEATTAHAVEEVLDDDLDPAAQDVPPVPPAESGAEPAATATEDPPPQPAPPEPAATTTEDLPPQPAPPEPAVTTTEDLPAPPAPPEPAATTTEDLPPPPAPPEPAATTTEDLPPPPAPPEAAATATEDLPPPPAPPEAAATATEDLPPPPAPADAEREAPATTISSVDEATTANAVEEVLDHDAKPAATEVPPATQEVTESAATDPPQATEPTAAPAADPTGHAVEDPERSTVSATDEATTANAVDEALASEPDATEAEATDAAAAGAEPDDPAKDPSSPNYGKTPAQIKYEQARAAANDLLAELRGELEAEGEI